MALLTEKELVWSSVVVNNRMNRERNASGVNSYEKEFNFRPEQYLESLWLQNNVASWMDICCGSGNALLQASRYFSDSAAKEQIKLHGIDLLNTALPSNLNPSPIIEICSAVDWHPKEKYDLITCVHGLHYIGDKLKVIHMAIASLKPGGLFIANLDMNNFYIQKDSTNARLKKMFKEMGIAYNSRKKLLQKKGPANIDFGLIYLGADDQSGPNYTGQPAVTSWYARQE